MPIPLKPIPPASKPQASPQKPFIPPNLAASRPSVTKPIVPSVSKPKASLHTPLTLSGERTLKGGLKVSHTAVVTDHSDDLTQMLPYFVHCDTCGFESKQKDYDLAVSMASSHVGS